MYSTSKTTTRTKNEATAKLASFLFTAGSLLTLSTHFLKKSNSLRLNLYYSGSLLKTVAQYSIIDASSYLFLSIQIAKAERKKAK